MIENGLIINTAEQFQSELSIASKNVSDSLQASKSARIRVKKSSKCVVKELDPLSNSSTNSLKIASEENSTLKLEEKSTHNDSTSAQKVESITNWSEQSKNRCNKNSILNSTTHDISSYSHKTNSIVLSSGAISSSSMSPPPTTTSTTPMLSVFLLSPLPTEKSMSNLYLNHTSSTANHVPCESPELNVSIIEDKRSTTTLSRRNTITPGSSISNRNSGSRDFFTMMTLAEQFSSNKSSKPRKNNGLATVDKYSSLRSSTFTSNGVELKNVGINRFYSNFNLNHIDDYYNNYNNLDSNNSILNKTTLIQRNSGKSSIYFSLYLFGRDPN